MPNAKRVAQNLTKVLEAIDNGTATPAKVQRVAIVALRDLAADIEYLNQQQLLRTLNEARDKVDDVRWRAEESLFKSFFGK